MEGTACGHTEGQTVLAPMPVPELRQAGRTSDERVVDIADEQLIDRSIDGRRLPQRPQKCLVVTGMGVPVVGLDRSRPRGRVAMPEFAVTQDDLAGSRDCVRRAGIDEETVLAGLDDVVRPAAVGGDERQAASGRFQKRQAERLVECRVYEHAVSLARISIERGNVRCLVTLRVSDLAVEIVAIDKVEDGSHLVGGLGIER